MFRTMFKKKEKEKPVEKSEAKESQDCFSPKFEVNSLSYCIVNPYFKSTEDFSKIFSDFEMRIASMQRYFEMNNSHIDSYIQRGKIDYRKKKEDGTDREILTQYSKCLFADVDYFYEIHYLSILMMLFSLFETLLSNVSKDLAYTKDKNLRVDFNNSSSYIQNYIVFLKNKIKLDLKFSREELSKLNVIRKVRNNYLHNLDKDIPKDLQDEMLKIINPQNNNKVTVNGEFLHMSFSLIGGLTQKIEKAYWDHKRKEFNFTGE